MSARPKCPPGHRCPNCGVIETLSDRAKRIGRFEKLPPMRVLRALEASLREIAPGSALIPRGDVHASAILTDGRAFSTVGLKVRRGEPSNCHANAAHLYVSGAAKGIGTGYVCAHEDGDALWRQHSWGLDARGRIIETTVKSWKYFGLEFHGDDALRFVFENAQPERMAAQALPVCQEVREATRRLALVGGAK